MTIYLYCLQGWRRRKYFRVCVLCGMCVCVYVNVHMCVHTSLCGIWRSEVILGSSLSYFLCRVLTGPGALLFG